MIRKMIVVDGVFLFNAFPISGQQPVLSSKDKLRFLQQLQKTSLCKCDVPIRNVFHQPRPRPLQQVDY